MSPGYNWPHLKYAPTASVIPSTERSSTNLFSSMLRSMVAYSSSVGSFPAHAQISCENRGDKKGRKV